MEILGGEPPWGCMDELRFSCRTDWQSVLRFIQAGTSRALAQCPQVFEREDARVVSIAPGDLIGVMANRRDGQRFEGRKFGGFENAKGVGGLHPILVAT